MGVVLHGRPGAHTPDHQSREGEAQSVASSGRRGANHVRWPDKPGGPGEDRSPGPPWWPSDAIYHSEKCSNPRATEPWQANNALRPQVPRILGLPRPDQGDIGSSTLST